jgi:hypothetical protein
MVVRMSTRTLVRRYYQYVGFFIVGLPVFGAVNHFTHGAASGTQCKQAMGVVTLSWPASRYPNIRRHWLATLAGTGASHRKWPSVYVLHREGAAQRRARLMERSGMPTRSGLDRDEQPPAFARSTWQADLAYVPSGENRSQGWSMGAKLSGYCDGTRFRYRWTR